MAIALPTSADVRKVRSQADTFVTNQWDMVRTPVLAWIGINDLAVQNLRGLPGQLRSEKLRARADKARDTAREKARSAYRGWADHGEATVRELREHPRVARAIRTVTDTDQQVTRRVERLVDEFHDGADEALSSVSSRTRSLGEKTARGAQRVSREAAGAVSEAAEEVAEGLTEAGDRAAHETRSTSRKAANRTAAAKPANARRATTTK
jgi:heparin binding hemagglutinin HbhA